MARAMRAESPRAVGASKTAGSRQRHGVPEKNPARNPNRAPRKVTTRTAKDRANRSPIARVVNRRDAPAKLRRFVFLALAVSLAAITLMMLVVVFQTRLAETQLGIDDIESQITAEQNHYDQLRLERSILREPGRLVTEATALGMVPGTKTDFRSVDPLAVAEVLVSTRGVDPETVLSVRDSLARYGAVKAAIGDHR